MNQETSQQLDAASSVHFLEENLQKLVGFHLHHCEQLLHGDFFQATPHRTALQAITHYREPDLKFASKLKNLWAQFYNYC